MDWNSVPGLVGVLTWSHWTGTHWLMDLLSGQGLWSLGQKELEENGFQSPLSLSVPSVSVVLVCPFSLPCPCPSLSLCCPSLQSLLSLSVPSVSAIRLCCPCPSLSLHCPCSSFQCPLSLSVPQSPLSVPSVSAVRPFSLPSVKVKLDMEL